MTPAAEASTVRRIVLAAYAVTAALVGERARADVVPLPDSRGKRP